MHLIGTATGRSVLALALLLLQACSAPLATEQEPVHGPAAGSGGINRAGNPDRPYLILVSFDGFRPDYLDAHDLPHFRRVVRQGARARALIPVFPSTTFPNHYSLVTGLYPEHHGIVDNAFYDPARGAAYSFRNRETVRDGTWYGGEPIWVTAERQGMVAACFFWPGSEAAIGGVRPTIWNDYDSDIPNARRVETALGWLRLPPERRPHLITLYFGDVDAAAHRAPLGSESVASAARSLDRALGALLDGIETLPIRDRIYLLLTSDHGMTETSRAHVIHLNTVIDTRDIRVGNDGPVTVLHVPDPERARQVRDTINARLQHGRAYLRREMPARFAYRSNPRAGDVVIVMEEPYMLESSVLTRALIQERWGEHGWDPAFPSMHALFLITGPGIRPGSLLPEVNNVDVYPLMAELLQLEPAPGIDGRAGYIRKLLAAAGAGAEAR